MGAEEFNPKEKTLSFSRPELHSFINLHLSSEKSEGFASVAQKTCSKWAKANGVFTIATTTEPTMT